MKASYISIFLACSLLGACLKRGLDPLPAFKDAGVTRFDFEYQWDDNGSFRVAKFNTASPVISGDTLYVTTTVPEVNSTFTADERNKVTINAIVGMCNVSTAANIKPVGDAPALGIPADFSKPAVYEVTAADAVTKKDWVLVTTLIK